MSGLKEAATMMVSVLMPVYNASQYIRAAAFSILTQTHKDLELIAIDDGSTDGTTEILQEIASSDRRVKLTVRENRGLVASLNEGLGLAQGALIARMDADDIAYPSRLSTQVEIFRQNPQLCLLGMGADYLYPGNYLIKSKTQPATHGEIRIESMFHNMFIHPSVMLNNNIISMNNIRYSASNPLNEDHELWSRIVCDHSAIIISETGLAWRQQHSSVRTRHFRAQMISCFDLVQRDLAKNGISIDSSIFSQLPAQAGALTKIQATQLKDAIKNIWDHRLAFSSQSAFERGFASLLSNIIDTALSLNDPSQIVRIISEAGLAGLISKRHKLAATLASWTNRSIAPIVMSGLREANRRISGRMLQNSVILHDLVVRNL
jgi:glycosyltransferase involved in cell wall biosynthesis